MKKVLFSAIAVALLSNVAYAGKNVQKAVEPPIPVPEKPIVPITNPVLPPLGLYIGGGLTYTHSECSCSDVTTCADGSSCSEPHTSNVYGGNLKVGYELTDYLDIEAKYIYTSYKGYDIKHYGVYFKPNYAITDNIDAYALLGYGKTECQLSNQAIKGFSWGVGTEYTLEGSKGTKSGLGVYAEYLQPVNKSGDKDIKIHMGNIGVAYHF